MRKTAILVVFSLVLICAERLPAPIVEESPTPAPEHSVKPKRTVAKAKRTTKSKTRATESEPSPSARSRQGRTPAPTKEFAGTWTGTIESRNPLVGVGPHSVVFVVNSTENSVKETGPVGTFTHPASVSGNTLTFNTGFFGEITVSMRLTGNGRVGRVQVNDRIWGKSSGTMKKQD